MFNPELQNDVYTNPEEEIFIPQEETNEAAEPNEFNDPLEYNDGFEKEPNEVTLNEEELAMIAKIYNVSEEDLIANRSKAA